MTTRETIEKWNNNWAVVQEMANNATYLPWTAEKVQEALGPLQSPVRQYVLVMSPEMCDSLIAQLRILYRFYINTTEAVKGLGITKADEQSLSRPLN